MFLIILLINGFITFVEKIISHSMLTLMFMEQKYSAASLCSITTEVLKVLNATEELLGEAEGKVHDPSPAGAPMSSGPGTRKLDQHLTKMEENVRFTTRNCSNVVVIFLIKRINPRSVYLDKLIRGRF